MNIAVAYHKGDREQTIRWMEWVAELGGLGAHKLYMIAAFDCEPIPQILPHVLIPDHERAQEPPGQLPWPDTSPLRSALAPNSMFRMFANHFHYQKLGYWLWCESDCIPLKVGWISKLEAEYVRGEKPFMGAHVLIDKVPEHMTGNGVYPQDVPSIGPGLITHTVWIPDGQKQEYELAFDIAGREQTLKQAHFTNLIQHKFRHEGFNSQQEVDDLLDPRAVLFHSNKTGDLIPFLRNNLSGGVESRHAANYAERMKTSAIAESTDLRADSESSDSPAQNNLSVSRRIGSRIGDIPLQEIPQIPAVLEGALVTGHLKNDLDSSGRQTSSFDTHESLTRDTVSILKQLCRSPVHTSKVRKELRTQKVIR